MARWLSYRRKKGTVLLNNALNAFYRQIFCIRYRVNDHKNSQRENLLLPLHGLLFLISNKGSFICTIPQTGLHMPDSMLYQLMGPPWRSDLTTHPTMSGYSTIYILLTFYLLMHSIILWLYGVRHIVQDHLANQSIMIDPLSYF